MIPLARAREDHPVNLAVPTQSIGLEYGAAHDPGAGVTTSSMVNKLVDLWSFEVLQSLNLARIT